MNYLCIVDGLIEYASTSESSFAHYQLVYAEEHKDADVQNPAGTLRNHGTAGNGLCQEKDA